MSTLVQSPSQTVGPYFSIGLIRQSGPQNVLVNQRTEGERIRIEGIVYDGAGVGIGDAMLEIWQADSHGRYRHPLDAVDGPRDAKFPGFGRCATGEGGSFYFETVKPGSLHVADRTRPAPHVNVALFARGMLVHAFTRMYFSDDALAEDPVLSVVDPDRRKTLVAERTERGTDVVYRWDIHLQGERETVFFDA